jgi:hypothetical protein
MDQFVIDKENELMSAPGESSPVPELIPLDQLPPLPRAEGGVPPE